MVQTTTGTSTVTNDRMATLVVICVMIAFIADGLDLQMLSLALPVLMNDLHLSKVAAGALGTWTLIGMGIGGTLTSWMADRFGRVKVTAWSLVLFSVGTALLAFTNSYWQFAFVRCISSFGLAAVYVVGSMLAAEYVSTERRTTVLGTLQAMWSVGYVAAALLSSWILPIYGWRPLFLTAIVPAIAAVWMLRYLSDSPSWTASRVSGGNNRNEWAEIWSDKKVRRTFLFWGLTATALQFGYYGANTWLPSYIVKELGVNLKNMGWYIAATYTAAIFGKIVTGWLADILGRRAVFAIVSIVTAAALPLIVKYSTPGNVAVLLLVFGLVYAAPYAVNATYMAESFPTSVRSTAVGAAYNLGKIGSIAAPLFIGAVATQYSIGLGIAILGISYAITGIVPALFIREKMYDPKTS